MANTLRPRKGEKVLRAVQPSAAIEVAYRRKLQALVEEMHRSVLWYIRAAYRANEPKIAQDEALPADALRAMMKKLGDRWLKKFDDAAPKLASYFATEVSKRSEATLRRILRDAGISVKFQMTPAMRDIVKATVNQQVSLIKSIPQQYLGQVEGAVMRSVQAGRDMEVLTKELVNHYGVTKRRAAAIALNQNNVASSAMNRARQLEAGITEAVWLHSHAGRAPRPTHVAMNGKRYDVAKGMYDSHEGRKVLPGELINCRCSSKPVVKRFS